MGFKSTAKTTLLVLVGLFGVASIAFFFAIPRLVLREVAKEDHLGRTGNTTYNVVMEKFRAPKYAINLQVWTFNVENANEVIALGKRPKVVEKGPYTFIEVTEKRWFRFTENDTRLLYRNNRNYTYSQELSCSSCNPTADRVVIPNILFQKLIDLADGNVVLRVIIRGLLKLVQENLFVDVSVSQLLFDGYEDKLIKGICGYDQITKEICKLAGVPDRIGLFYGQNNTDDGLYEIDTGLTNSEMLGHVYSWNGMTHLKEAYWHGEQARMINGTDGQLFRPGLTDGESLHVFSGQICRSIDLEQFGYSVYEGAQTHRYRPAKSMQDVTLQKAIGFCTPDTPLFFNDTHVQQAGCAPSGLLDLQSCAPGNPSRVFASQAHFFDCPDALWRSIDGIKPPSSHDDSTYVEIEPISGAVVQAQRRSQISLGVTVGKLQSSFPYLRNTIVPVIWINESATIDADTLSQVLRPVHILRDSFLAAVGLLVLTALSLVTYIGIVVSEIIIQRRGVVARSTGAGHGPAGYDPLVDEEDGGGRVNELEGASDSLPGMPSPQQGAGQLTPTPP